MSQCGSVVDDAVQVRRDVKVEVVIEGQQVLVVVLHLLQGHVGRVLEVATRLDAGVHRDQ